MGRGRKVQTALNSDKRACKELIRHETLEPPCDLTVPARSEYDRLVGALQAKGTLDRCDLGVIAECSRIKALLDRLHAFLDDALDSKVIATTTMLTSQRRGLRELGLTTAPNRSLWSGRIPSRPRWKTTPLQAGSS